MKKILFAIMVLSLSATAQEDHFSNIEETPLHINPANAGLKNDIRAIALFRSQWNSVGSQFQTSGFSFDMRATDESKAAYLGLGVNAVYDNAGYGNMNTTKGNVNLTCILTTDGYNKISMGLNGGLGNRTLNILDSRWESQYDGAYNSSLASGESFVSGSYNYYDVGAGVAWAYGRDAKRIKSNDGVKVNVGISAHHFGIARSSFYAEDADFMNTKFAFNANGEFGKKQTNLTFIPTLYAAMQGSLSEIVVGNKFRYLLQEGSRITGRIKAMAVYLGAYYRYNDALIGTAGIEYGNFAAGFSYDLNISSLSSYSSGRGGVEFFLKFVTPNPFSVAGRAKW